MRAISAFCILQSNSALYDLSAAVELNVVGSYVAAAIRIFFARHAFVNKTTPTINRLPRRRHDWFDRRASPRDNASLQMRAQLRMHDGCVMHRKPCNTCQSQLGSKERSTDVAIAGVQRA